jgi:hypothetical protein
VHDAPQLTTCPESHGIADIHDDSALDGAHKLPASIVLIQNLEASDGLVEEEGEGSKVSVFALESVVQR